MDNRWYVAKMEKDHVLSGYRAGATVYFKREQLIHGELIASVYGLEVAEKISRTIIVYDGESTRGFKMDKDEVGIFIRACRDANKKPVPADNQHIIQYNFITRCNCQ